MDASDADISVQTIQTASADQQASQPQRSRTTVVCGECKRLKLKCDRKQPCGSCLKRDSVQKCLYSAAAIEKLDIHSLNNRLTHIETYTMIYTNGRFQPAYVSANHSSLQTVHNHMPNYAYQSTQQNPGGHHHQHHHHAGVLNHHLVVETFSLPFQSIISTCLRDLGFTQNPTSSTQGDIKLEPSAMDIATTFCERLSNSRRMSKSQLRQLLRDHRTHARSMVPSITVYFSATPSNPATHVPQNSVPQVTSGLLSCLPPLATCQRLLHRAGDVFRVRPLPFDPSYGSGYGWNGLERRCLQFLSNTGKNKEGKRPRAVVKRARDIYLAGPSQPLLNQSSLLDAGGSVGYMVRPPNAGDGGHHSSLTFFAMTCAALAIGAVSSPSEDDCALAPSSAAFFYALSQQALGIWDTHFSSSTSKHSTTKGDAEQIEYLFACLLNVVYLLQSGTVAAASLDKVGDDEDTEIGDEPQDDDSQIVSSLVGKMITVARNMHLNKESTWTKRKKKKSSDRDRSRDEWKRMVWWEIVYYDLFIADALGLQPHISPSPYSTNIPSCATFSPPTKSEGEKPVSEDTLHGTDQDRVQNVSSASFHHDQLRTETRDEEACFGARYQLARVAQAVKSRNSLPDCCCGYTLDQAVALENQVREWQDTLPAFLKISGDDETQSTTAGSNAEGALRQLQAYELAIASNVLVINVYMPFLGMDGEDGIGPRFTNLPAASACIHAAQAIVHLADGLQSLLSSPSVSSSFPSKVMPLMFQFIPLEKLVFDAVIVCAHAAFAGKSPPMAFSTGMMADDASLGLKVLQKLGPPLLSSVIERDGDDEFQSRVIGALHARLVQRSMRLKRKFDEEIACGDFVQGGPDAGHTSHQVSEQDPPTQQHTFIIDSLSSPSSTLESDYSGSLSPSSARQSSRSNREPKSLNKEKGKKGKKGVKNHPAVGLRLREASSVHSVPQSLPPLSAKAEDVWKLGQQIRMSSAHPNSSPPTNAMMPTMSPVAISGGSFTGTGRRSPSSSQVHQPVDSSLRFVTPPAHSPDEMGMPSRKRLALQDIREQLQPQPVPFVSHVFDQHRQTQRDIDYNQLMPSTTFNGQRPTAGTMDPAAYRVAPSTQSPFMSISTPEHTTPTYDPHLPLSSIAQSTTYFPSPTSYGPPYVEQLPSSNVIGLLHTPVSGNSAPIVVDSQPPMMNTPVYEQSQQQPVENYSPRSQAHHMQNLPYHGHLVSGEPQHSVDMYDLGNSTVTGLGW